MTDTNRGKKNKQRRQGGKESWDRKMRRKEWNEEEYKKYKTGLERRGGVGKKELVGGY